MKVKELIEALQKQDPELDVEFNYDSQYTRGSGYTYTQCKAEDVITVDRLNDKVVLNMK